MAHAVFDSSVLSDLSPVLDGGGVCWLDQASALPRPLPWPDDTLLGVVIATAGALALDLAPAFAAALVRRLPEGAICSEELCAALQEAVGNAVTHGNMGLDGSMRASLEGLHAYSRAMEAAKADPVIMGLPVCVWAERKAGGIAVSVEDQGAGFSPPSSDSLRTPVPRAGGGMGLSIIARSVRDLTFTRGGRRVTMTFPGSA